MAKATLWLEIIIVGYIYFLSTVFLILYSIGIYDLCFFSTLKDYLVYISLASIAASYLFGIVVHRFIQLAIQFFYFTFKKKEYKKHQTERNERIRNIIKVYQKGSQRLNRELDFQYSLIALFRSLVFAIPYFGINFGIWLNKTNFMRYSNIVFLFTCIFTILFFGVYRIQKKHYSYILECMYSELK